MGLLTTMNRYVLPGRPAGDSSDEENEIDGYVVCGSIQYNSRQHDEEVLEAYKKEHRHSELVHQIISGNLQGVKDYLDQNDLSIDDRIRQNENALYLAASYAKYTIVVELLNRGADPNAQADGKSVFMAALEKRHEDLISFVEPIIMRLIESGARIDVMDMGKQTPLMLACAQGIPSVVKFLLPRSKLEAEDNRGWTALFYAVTANMLEIVILLLRNNANVYHVDNENFTVLDYAGLYELDLMLQFLQDFTGESALDEIIYDKPRNIVDTIRDQMNNNACNFLKALKCDVLIPQFRNNDIDFIELFTMSVENWDTLNIKNKRKKVNLLNAIHELHCRPFKFTSLEVFVNESEFSSDYFLATIANTIKNMTIIYISILYIKKKRFTLLRVPLPIEVTILDNCLGKIKNIVYVIKLLQEKAKQHDNKKPADWIVNKSQSRVKPQYTKYLLLSGATTLAIYFLRIYKNAI